MPKKPTTPESASTAPAPVDPLPPDLTAPIPEAESDPAPTVVVTALQPSRWRIGRKFGAEPVAIPAEDLSEDEYAALKADPLLTVQVVGAPY